ncbi:MAG TPA: FtsW/RodA/SpoVE family cell cycle protein, partial [bacterium]|nr:FtsW/RodA/SpoVE family cell cycle protein [bacterium]
MFGGFLIIHSPYRINRIKGWVLGETDPLNKGYHITRSKLALATGGFLGKGLTHSEVKIAGLPEAHTDFIFAVLGEEIGFLGAIFIIFFYLLLLYRGLKIARDTQNVYFKFLALGISVMI